MGLKGWPYAGWLNHDRPRLALPRLLGCALYRPVDFGGIIVDHRRDLCDGMVEGTVTGALPRKLRTAAEQLRADPSLRAQEIAAWCELAATKLERLGNEACKSEIPLTKRQGEILAFIRSHIVEYGISPTYDEIRVAMGMRALSSVYEQLHKLQQKGHLVIYRNMARGLIVTDL